MDGIAMPILLNGRANAKYMPFHKVFDTVHTAVVKVIGVNCVKLLFS